MKPQLFPKRKINPLDAPYGQSGIFYMDVAENKFSPTNDLTVHVTATDPHTGYELESAYATTQIKTAKATVIMDLSGGAVSNVPILHTSRALTFVKALVVYTEASSADAGVTITIGKESNGSYYYTGTSETSKAIWYEKDVTLLATDIAAGDTVICGTAGGKVGTGEVLICIEYSVN